MAHVKAIGAGKYGKDSRPKYRGVKLHDGQPANAGNIIVRQTGASMIAGLGVRTGSDYTLYAGRGGVVKFHTVRKLNYDGSRRQATVVSVVAAK
jgi:large subunit ribosomal protein L27